jgi:uncharacterized membrane protein
VADRDRSPDRLAALTDGVVAIVMTLLALDIRLPMPATGLSNRQLLGVMEDALPTLFGYALSFVVIAQFWLIHHRKFARLKHVDGGLFWLNVLFLLCIGVIPFVTSVLAENPGTVATVAYAGVIAAVSISLGATALYAGARDLLERDGTEMTTAATLVRSLLPGAVFLLSIPVAFYDADLAKYSWLLLIPAGFAMRFFAPAGKRRG